MNTTINKKYKVTANNDGLELYIFRFASIQSAICTNFVFIGWNCTINFESKYGNDTNAIEKMIGIIHTGFIGIGSIELSCTLPFLAYMIGISLTDFNMYIDNIISTNTITNMKINIHITLDVPEKLPYIL